MNADLVVLSLGAGVQSSTLAILAERGEITPKPDAAIFADTGWEPKAVYEWLEWLKGQLSYPVSVVSNGDLRANELKAQIRGREEGGRFLSLPLASRNGSGEVGRIRRQCTKEYKLWPIEWEVRRLLGLKKGQRVKAHVEQWRGISVDEAHRMKPSDKPWMIVRYPLAMELGWTRQDCKRWWEREGLPVPPRSACIGCPYHSDAEWRAMRDGNPSEWQDAIEFDRAIRKAGGARGETFIHRAAVPLDEVDLSTPEDHGQQSLFGEECEGMCGL